MPKVALPVLERTVRAALKRLGYDDGDAKIIQEVLLYGGGGCPTAQLRGNNQGIVKLVGNALARSPKVVPIREVRRSATAALLDGGQNNGMVVAARALETAIQLARDSGVAAVGMRNTCTSTGAIGYYVDRAARQGFVAFFFAGSRPTVTTEGATEAIFGTNPLAIGLPSTDADPVVLDMATSAIAWFGLVEADTAGRPIPDNVALDAAGQPTTSAAEALKGVIRPFDRGNKSSGLAFMVEALTGSLVAATYGGIGDLQNWGNLILLIDPAVLAGREPTARGVAELTARLHSLRKAPGVGELLVPGERGNRLSRKHQAEGMLPIEDALWRQVRIAAGEEPAKL